MGSLLDAVLEASQARRDEASPAPLDRFLGEPDPWEALATWLRLRGLPSDRPTREAVARRLVRDIAAIDILLNRQVNAILHHKAFARLEATWRGLGHLAAQASEGDRVKVRILDVSWRELARDAERALEFDQSLLFRKVYEEEFGRPGGEPFGVLLGDFEVRNRPQPGHPYDDVATLSNAAAVAAAAFAPFLAAAHPSLLDMESFAELERPRDLARSYDGLEHLKWRTFRRSEDSRFVGLLLPRVLARLPHPDDGGRDDGFRFREEIESPGREGYLWGNPVYAMGAILIRAFINTGWFAEIRGVPAAGGGGRVDDLPAPSFATDAPGVAPKCSTDVVVTDAQEKLLGELGLIPLCHRLGSTESAFFGNQSVQQPQAFDEPAATANAGLMAMLQYTLCVSRFAHYLKVMARDKVGAFISPADCEEYLRRWLMDYTVGNDTASPELKARHPLREARVQVHERPDRPGHYRCVAHLRPHFQLDQMAMAVRLTTELATADAG